MPNDWGPIREALFQDPSTTKHPGHLNGLACQFYGSRRCSTNPKHRIVAEK